LNPSSYNWNVDIEGDEMGRSCSTHGEKTAYRILVGEPEGKRPPGRPRRRWEDNIRMDLRGIGWGGMEEGKRPPGRPRRRRVDNIRMDLRGIGWGGMDWIDLA
jgi:hypothetical protein